MSFTYNLSFNTIKCICSHSIPLSHLYTLLSFCSNAVLPYEKREKDIAGSASQHLSLCVPCIQAAVSCLSTLLRKQRQSFLIGECAHESFTEHKEVTVKHFFIHNRFKLIQYQVVQRSLKPRWLAWASLCVNNSGRGPKGRGVLFAW